LIDRSTNVGSFGNSFTLTSFSLTQYSSNLKLNFTTLANQLDPAATSDRLNVFVGRGLLITTSTGLLAYGVFSTTGGLSNPPSGVVGLCQSADMAAWIDFDPMNSVSYVEGFYTPYSKALYNLGPQTNLIATVS
jgi:hypothetical protein